MILVENLRKQYGQLVAVDGVSFAIEDGETFGFLGPNGAGKSTTVNMLAGVLTPDGGSITVNGSKDPTQAAVRRRLGSAPQALAIYEELTGEENVAFFGRLYSLSGRYLKERVDWALDFVGLDERRKSRAKTYSGGMQRRLNLACAVVHDPAVLLLDEPTVGVDPQSRNLIFEKIEDFKSQGRTILYTTHYMEEAERLCDRVAIIDKGQILAMDTVAALVAAHGGDSVVEAELASPPDNPADLPGRLEGTTLRVETRKPLEVVGKLAAGGNRFLTMRVDQADLESVFLNLTGKRLRD